MAPTTSTSNRDGGSKLPNLKKSAYLNLQDYETLKRSLDARLHKRPLYHPPIPSPYAGASKAKVVYIKPSTPFMSAVNRVRGLLRQIDKRGAQSVVEQTKDIRGDQILTQARMGLAEASKEAVTIKGTGRAIEKVLSLAAWFVEREVEEGVKVRLSTGSVTAIDDLLPDGSMDDSPGAGETGNKENIEGNEDMSESRLRQLSVLEVKIWLR
jgi:ribonuclease P/MRP protein subunit POP7